MRWVCSREENVTPPPGSFRVIVVRSPHGSSLSGPDATSVLAERIPIPEDARIALEAGRSAVVSFAATEQQARRVATQVMKLGFEVRIEPDDSPVRKSRAAAPLPSRPPAPSSESPPPPIPGPERTASPEQLPARADATEPILTERPYPWEDSSFPAHPLAEAGTDGTPLTDAQPPGLVAWPEVDDRLDLDHTQPGHESETPAASVRLVRCPAHGLLYDASKSNGCSRCLGGSARERGRLLPTLRSHPRMWLTAGVLLALGIGAIPAVIYAQQVKSGSLLEHRIEAQAIRLTRGGGPDARAAYLDARDQVARIRTRAIAVTALIWLSCSVLLLLLYRRFV